MEVPTTTPHFAPSSSIPVGSSLGYPSDKRSGLQLAPGSPWHSAIQAEISLITTKPEDIIRFVESRLASGAHFGDLLAHAGGITKREGAPVDTHQYREISPERESLKQAIYDLLKDAGTPDWDGGGALAITAETVVIAQKLVDRFPSYVASPDVSATPHGEVDFDWVPSKDVMLTVSIGPSKEVAFAGLFHGTRLNGSEPWNGILPQFVECCFERLYSSLK